MPDFLILNGNAAARAEVRTAVAAWREHVGALEVRVTWERGDAQRYVHEAVDAHAGTVIAGGGDGTLHEVCGALAALDTAAALPAVGVLPLGTANDFATAIGMPMAPHEALQAIARSTPYPIDLLRIAADGERRWCVNVATGGFGTRITVETDPTLKRLLGKAAYLLTGLTRFDSVKAAFARFEGPDFQWEGEFLVLALGNSRLAGGGQPLAPDARVDDGLLDLTVLPKPAEGELGATLGTLVTQGKAALIEQAVRARLSWVRIQAPDGLTLNLDGEPFEATCFRADVLPGCLRLRAPSHADVVGAPLPAAG